MTELDRKEGDEVGGQNMQKEVMMPIEHRHDRRKREE